MNTINQYKNRFYNLLESTIGDVRPLITEDETVSVTSELNQIAKNLGLKIGPIEESAIDVVPILNPQVLNPNVTEAEFVEISDHKGISLNLTLNKVGRLTGDAPKIYFNYMNKSVSLDTIKKYITEALNGNFDKNLIYVEELKEDGLKFYDLFLNNNLEGYDSFLDFAEFYFDTNGKLDYVYIVLLFKSKNPDNKVKYFLVYPHWDKKGELYVSYNNISPFLKEYVLDGNKISFEKDRKSTKPTGRYKYKKDNESITLLLDLVDGGNEYVVKGMKGEIVKEIQSALLNSGQLKTTFKLTANNQKCMKDYTFCDGIFGSKTYDAVKEFQEANDLVADGIVGPDTAEALETLIGHGGN